MFKIVRKELISFLKDRRAVMLTFAVPIILLSIFALAFGGVGKDSDVNKIPLLVVDEDNTAQSKEIVKGVDSIKMIEVIHATNDSALHLIKTGKRSAALVFHKGFADSLAAGKSAPMELEYDEAQAQQIGMLQQFLMQTLYTSIGKQVYGGGKFNWQSMMKKFGVDVGTGGNADSNNKYNSVAQKISDSIQNSFTGSAKKGGGLRMTSVVKSAQDSLGMVQSVAGTAVMMLLFSLTAMGGRILEEKENGTLKRLLYSPLHSNEILMGKMATSIIVAFSQLMVMLIYASVLLGLHLWGKLPLAIMHVLATAFACSGFGVFLAAVVKSREQLQGLSTLVILSMSAIGGSMIPTFIMPSWMQSISPLSINYWSIQGFYDIFWRQLPLGPEILQREGVLLLIGLVLTLVAFRLFRKNVLATA